MADWIDERKIFVPGVYPLYEAGQVLFNNFLELAQKALVNVEYHPVSFNDDAYTKIVVMNVGAESIHVNLPAIVGVNTTHKLFYLNSQTGDGSAAIAGVTLTKAGDWVLIVSHNDVWAPIARQFEPTPHVFGTPVAIGPENVEGDSPDLARLNHIHKTNVVAAPHSERPEEGEEGQRWQETDLGIDYVFSGELGWMELGFMLQAENDIKYANSTLGKIYSYSYVKATPPVEIATGQNAILDIKSDPFSNSLFYLAGTDQRLRQILWDGTNQEDLAITSTFIFNLSYYPKTNQIFYFDNGVIYTVDRETKTKTQFSQAMPNPGWNYLAIGRFAGYDWLYFIYYDGATSYICRGDIDAATPAAFTASIQELHTVAGGNWARNLAIDGTTIFWSEVGDEARIRKGTIDADGIDDITTVISNLNPIDTKPQYIVIDRQRKRIVFTPGGGSFVDGALSCDYEGFHIAVMQDMDGNDVGGIALDYDTTTEAMRAVSGPIEGNTTKITENKAKTIILTLGQDNRRIQAPLL